MIEVRECLFVIGGGKDKMEVEWHKKRWKQPIVMPKKPIEMSVKCHLMLSKICKTIFNLEVFQSVLK